MEVPHQRESLFTAAQIAWAIDRSARQAARVMLGAGAPRTASPAAWAVRDFPGPVREKLQALSARGGYRDIAHFLNETAGRWEPQVQGRVVTIGELAEHHGKTAGTRRDIFAPILSRDPLANVAQIVREGRALLDLWKLLPPADERTARRWVEQAKERDRLRYEWQRPELWLDNRLSLREAGLAAPAAQSPIATDLDEDSFWRGCAMAVELHVSTGKSEAAARAAVLAGLTQIPKTLVGSSPDAMRMALVRRWKQYRERGTIGDRRAENSGRISVATLLPEEHAMLMRLAVASGGSQVTVLRRYAQSNECPEAIRESILKEKSSRHKIARALRERITPTPELCQ